MNQTSWDVRCMHEALAIAQWSTDKSLKVGAIIVDRDHNILSSGFNCFCHGIKEDVERTVRPLKYVFTEHAERNAIYSAAKRGISLVGSTIYVDTTESDDIASTSCVDCCRAIIQVGIVRIVHRPMGSKFKELAEEMGGWRADWKLVTAMYQEAGIVEDWISRPDLRY